jgi:hypothetical protein
MNVIGVKLSAIYPRQRVSVPLGQGDGRTQQHEVPRQSGIEPRLSGPSMQSSHYMAYIMYDVGEDPYFILQLSFATSRRHSAARVCGWLSELR